MRLRRVCQTCPQLELQPEDGREFSVTLVGRPRQFLDACSPHDLYPPEMWLDAATYFKNLSKEEMYLPGGRYACARVLVARGLPFLAGCSLGQVCHIVQLAISQKRILGYLEGQLVPYIHSEEWVKEQCAFHQQPICSKEGANSLPVASWEDARRGLLQLLESESSPELGVVTLSNVKRLFRSRFQIELSETALGHSRLFDLFHDVRFRDVCIVQAHRNGQLLVKRVEGPKQVAVADSFNQAELRFPGTGCVQTPPEATQAAPPGVWNHVFMGSVIYPQMPMVQINAPPPSLSTLRKVEVDMGMESRWHCLSTGVPSGDSPCQNPVANPCLKRYEEDSGLSTDAPSMQDMCAYSSDDGESALALQAEEIRAEEERIISFGFCATSETWPVAPKNIGCQHVVKNSFIDLAPSTV